MGSSRVAKDWCLAIRASQVIPVYPLTEDVQPGDVFLVQVPYETQIHVYETKGFLPLENLVTRMYPEGYLDFYKGRYGIEDDKSIPPGLWQFPKTAGGAVDYARAPRAAFPTYGFSVSRSEGLNAAVPVQGIPVGLNMLNSSSATGRSRSRRSTPSACPSPTSSGRCRRGPTSGKTASSSPNSTRRTARAGRRFCCASSTGST